MTTLTSWFHPNAEKRPSRIEGRGLFARAPIRAGEIVAVKGGAVMGRAALDEIRDEISPAEIQIEDHLWIAPRSAAEVEANLLCLNHSCEPTWVCAARSPSSRCATSNRVRS
ncbi:MAG TPA: SET domain-containing protein [Longimicrobiales bacterium]|nr:SET domain-containing protein [Longimicrobiales bacterium]